MDDGDIIERFWGRSETAISALGEKYGRYCRAIAFNILGSAEDAEEVVNDAYNRAWNAMPPERPADLRAFIGRVARNLALNRLERERAGRRGGGQFDLVLSELGECVADSRDAIDDFVASEVITAALNTFLSGQSAQNRRIFVRRYWKADAIKEIAGDYGISVGKVKSILFRMRAKLRTHLKDEGVIT
jgi:RNA polymerase sigma-70 factor (ECF subfamily)